MVIERTSLWNRLFATTPDPREALRPLWHRIVVLARDPQIYTDCGVADSVAGRFDMVTAILAIVVRRMEADDDLRRKSAYLIELFVEDMDGQLREFGVGDVVVGKHVGKLMSVAGGRLGSYRAALNKGDKDAFAAALRRNVDMADEAGALPLAAALGGFAVRLDEVTGEQVLAGDIDL